MTRFQLRLVLDLVAALLLIAGLAYWWLGNLAHELIGAGMFLLVLSHNLFNRRWYGRIPKEKKQPRGRIVIALNLTFLAMMVLLLVSSIIVSRSLFAFLPVDGGQLMRDLHKLAAYWAILLVGVHLGLNWTIVMNVVRSGVGLSGQSTARMIAVRVAAFVIAGKGALSLSEMTFGSKLINEVTMDMWDFTSQTPQFFLNYLSIIGLFALLSHYAVKLAPARQRVARPVGTGPQ
jgi:hypothetical protein